MLHRFLSITMQRKLHLLCSTFFFFFNRQRNQEWNAARIFPTPMVSLHGKPFSYRCGDADTSGPSQKAGLSKNTWVFSPRDGGVGGDAGLTKLVLNSESVTCGSIVFIIYVYIIGDAEHVSKATIGQKWYRCTQMIFIHVCCVPRSQTPQTSPGSLLQNCRY